MPNYQNGKIYKITSGDIIYIGSTCEPTLARRLAKHVANYTGFKKGKDHFISSYTLIETGQYEITLIELFPCGSKDELTARERFHIETNECVNRSIPGRTKEEHLDRMRKHYETNKEYLQERMKSYREDHKEQIAEQRKAYRIANRDIVLEKERLSREKRKLNRSKLQPKHREAVPLPFESAQPS